MPIAVAVPKATAEDAYMKKSAHCMMEGFAFDVQQVI